jgi:hypothetical protein
MSTLRRLRNFWILWVTTVVLACFSNAVAQASYLGTLGNDNLGCAMSINNQSWTEKWWEAPGTPTSTGPMASSGRTA